MKIIDVHAHVYPDAVAPLAVRSIGGFYEMPTRLDGTAAGLLQSAEGSGITSFVVHAVAVNPRQVSKINAFLAQIARRDPRLIPFAALHPEDPDMEATVASLRGEGFCGVKLHPDFQRFPLDGEASIAMFRLVAEYGLPALIHAGDSRYGYSHPRQLSALMKAVPKLTVLAAHLGGWSEWREARELLPGTERLWVDTSSSLYALTPEEAADMIRAYGAERVCFGTDYPMWRPKEEVEKLQRLPLTDGEMEEVCHSAFENMMQFSGISIPDEPALKA